MYQPKRKENMTIEALKRTLTRGSAYDLSFHSIASSDNGNKISIQGKNLGDSITLYQMLSDFLTENNIPFKVATWNRFALAGTNPEQAKKAMTIYCPDGFNFEALCEQVYLLTVNYKGWHNIKTPRSYAHYAGGLFIRNDRDASGRYVPAF